MSRGRGCQGLARARDDASSHFVSKKRSIFSPAEGSSSILRAADAVCRRRLARARGRVIGVLVAVYLRTVGVRDSEKEAGREGGRGRERERERERKWDRDAQPTPPSFQGHAAARNE